MTYKHVQAGWYEDGDKKIWMKSKMERNYCHYLEWLKSRGEIHDWAYEPTEFRFPVRRGTQFYKPDFRIIQRHGAVEYHEVKGYWTKKARTQVKRFRKYYPDETLRIIDTEVFRAIARDCKNLVPNWEA